jgi:hypothetical protein
MNSSRTHRTEKSAELKPQDPKASDEASAFYTYIFGMK